MIQSWRPRKSVSASKKTRQYSRMFYFSLYVFLLQLNLAAILAFVSDIFTLNSVLPSYFTSPSSKNIIDAYLGYFLLAAISFLKDDVFLPVFCFLIGCVQVAVTLLPFVFFCGSAFQSHSNKDKIEENCSFLSSFHHLLFVVHAWLPYFFILVIDIFPIFGVRIQQEEEEPLHILSRFNFYLRPFSGVARLILKLTGFSLFQVSAVSDIDAYVKKRDSDLIGDFSEMYRMANTLEASVNNNPKYDPIGVLILRLVHVLRPLSIRRQVLDYAFEHRRELDKIEINQPIIITGFPRSGTTLLQELFAQDPYARSLRGWEPQYPLPPTEKETYFTDSRITRYSFDLFCANIIEYGFFKRANQSHVIAADVLEEDTMALIQSQLHVVLGVMTDDEMFHTAHDEEGKRHCYEYLKLFLKVVGSKYGPNQLHPKYGHWVTKSPLHSIFPKNLFDVFPDAKVIVAHRDPYEVAASWARLQLVCCAHCPNIDRDDFDSREYIKECATRSLRQIRLMAERLHAFRSTHANLNETNIVDVSFRKLIADPIATVKEIYSKYGMMYTQEFEEKMKRYLEEQKVVQQTYGKAVFDADKDFCFTRERVHSTMGNYYQNYGQYL